MGRTRALRRTASLMSASIAALVAPSLALAQDADGTAETSEVDDIVVTGSLIRSRQDQTPSPLDVVTAADIQAQGARDVSDVVVALPANTGSQFNADVQGQGGTLGTSNVNLRGLGLNATLILLNGRRQTEYGLNNADGVTFVDVNSLVPLIAVQEVAVLKDGAAATYGSDAVAGVVNFLTRDRFEGAELQVGYQATTDDAQTDFSAAGIFGRAGPNWRVVGAFSHLDRAGLSAADRPETTAGSNISTLGQPGSFQPVYYPIGAGGRPNTALAPLDGGPPVADPLCGAPGVGGIRGAGVGPDGGCGYDSSGFNSLVPEETRTQLFFTGEYRPSDTLRLRLEAGYAKSDAQFQSSPGFPIVQFPIVPANNPGNTFVYTRSFGPPGSGQQAGAPAAVRFFGRAFGSNDTPQVIANEHELHRIALSAQWDLPKDWTLDLSATRSASEVFATREDINAAEFAAALRGQGGPNRNQFFNPFGNAALARPGEARYNAPEVIDLIRVVSTNDAERTLTTLGAVLSGDLFSLPAGPLSIALGLDYREEEIAYDLDDLANADGLLFFLGDQDFSGSRDVYAAFVEVRAPLSETLDLQIAGRFEDYGDFNNFDPKAALLWKPIEAVTLRGTVGTSFRAPSLFQTFGSRTAVGGVDDPLTNSRNIFRPIRTVSNQNLEPETATNFGLGGTFRPLEGFSVDLDYWNYQFEDRIVRRNPQSIINANPLDPRILRAAGSNQIQRIDAEFFNAASVETDGIDLDVRYALPAFPIGDLRVGLTGSWILSYDIQESPAGPVIDAVGSRNYANSGSPTPEFRGVVSAAWTHGDAGLNVFVRYIDGYRDDRPGPGDGRVEDVTTVDLQGHRDLSGLWTGPDLRIAFGATNVFDQRPPRVVSELGFDPRVHDPRGRLLYLRVTASF
jgi:iron complex outermembrane recepter protein